MLITSILLLFQFDNFKNQLIFLNFCCVYINESHINIQCTRINTYIYSVHVLIHTYTVYTY